MRWLVEVTSLGKSEKESLHVEAESWQKALQSARGQRGESAPMSGFSIELLDDGCRAVDPMSRLRYEVRKAPEDSPGTRSSPPRPASQPPPASKKSQPVAIGSRTMMGVGVGAVGAVEPVASPAGPQAPPHAPMPISAPVAVAAPVRADVASNVASQIIFKREQDATEAMPLTYREYVYVVPPGTTEGAAETLLQTQLEMVRSSLERVAPGKLVNLGVFDVAFRGKPPVKPLATLAWKDWRGPPVVTFPRRASSSRPPAPAVFTQAPAPVHAAVVAPAPAAPVVQPTPVIDVVPVAAQVAAPVAAPVAPQAPTPPMATAPIPVLAAPPPVVFAPAPAPAPPVPEPAAAPPPPVAAAPAPVFAAPQPAPAPVAPVAAPAPAPIPAPALPMGAVIFQAPAPVPVATAPAPAAQPRTRVRGEDLIADLFEAMHDLHFVRDAIEGGEFCLALAMEKLPSQAGIVHLYDIDRREFLVTSTRGAATGKLLMRRHPEGDALLSAAMRRRRALVIPDAAQSEAAGLDRYAALGGARSLMIAPVMQSGRFLGAIELMNPLDGQPFTDSEGNALSYIAEQFAEFISTHGIVTDPERISSRQLPDL
ncbi:MAG TPA: GAF domain-containing protein [Polyangiaceae bacterium]